MTLVELKRLCPLLPRPHETWRLTPRVPGGINGLDRTFHGIAVATNGIMVALETPKGDYVFGHLDWFVKDKPDDEPLVAAKRQRPLQMVKSLPQLEEFYE